MPEPRMQAVSALVEVPVVNAAAPLDEVTVLNVVPIVIADAALNENMAATGGADVYADMTAGMRSDAVLGVVSDDDADVGVVSVVETAFGDNLGGGGDACGRKGKRSDGDFGEKPIH